MSKPLTMKTQIPSFTKFLLQSPKKVSAATGMVLNGLAFETQKDAKKIIKKEMTVRSAFALRQIQVTKSKFKGDPNILFSLVGSVKKKRFTGWAEQEHGTKTDRHGATIAARGSKAKPIKRGARLAKPYFTPRRFPKSQSASARIGRSRRGGNWRIPAMLRILRRMGYSQPFLIVPGYRGIPAGLYKIDPADEQRLIQLQSLAPKRQQPRSILWMRRSLRGKQKKTEKIWTIAQLKAMGKYHVGAVLT
jgi:hypothetical protein